METWTVQRPEARLGHEHGSLFDKRAAVHPGILMLLSTPGHELQPAAYEPRF